MSTQPKFEVQLKIRKPVEEVFEGVVDPEEAQRLLHARPPAGGWPRARP